VPGIQKQLPIGMTGKIVYDSTMFIMEIQWLQ